MTNVDFQLAVPLVGSHFHPPAKQVLKHLPAGAELILRPEPDNPYDSEAILVLVQPGEVFDSQLEALAESLTGTGTDLEDFQQMEELILGHIAASGGKPATTFGDGRGTKEVAALAGAEGPASLAAQLGFLPEGQPMVLVGLR